MRSLHALLLVALAVGCGRSSLLGSPYDCPADQLLPNGQCMGPDLKPGPDLITVDMVHICPELCLQNNGNECDIPQCCGCTFCENEPQCKPPVCDGGMAPPPDAGCDDECADPRNCALPQCVGDPRCHRPGDEVCNNGLDDDEDNDVDCDDSDCAAFPNCVPHMCDQNNPNCADPACVMHPLCQNLKCMPTVDFGSLNPTNSSSTKMLNTTGTTDVDTTPCAPGGFGQIVGQFTLTGISDLTVSFTQPQGRDHVFGIFRAGINQTCGQNPVGCYDPKSATSGSQTFQRLDPGNYYIITQVFSPLGQGMVNVTLSTPSMPEICNNGVDDNSNGLIDCADLSCAMAPNCVNLICTPDINSGTLIVNGPAHSHSFSTSAADADNDTTCQGAFGGKDVVVRFTLQETGGLLVQWSQSGDHVIAIFRTPTAGLPCDNDEITCYEGRGDPAGTVAFGEYPPGDYLIIVKALRPGDEGNVDLQISAYRNRRIELCANGIDDDNNGLIDCNDPTCAGVGGCDAPFCVPDVQFGVMNVGDSKSTTLNVMQNGDLGYDVSCAKGGAKGMVVQLTVGTPGPNGGVGIAFQCTQPSGDHVLGLFRAGGPRDPCDTNELVCGDPKTLPFGCGYVIPNMQPGTYNVIASAFTGGTEGTVNLTLSILDDRVLENCTNGTDDDQDGFTDCNDRKCATNSACANNICRPDHTINPMPLNMTVVSRLVQTAGSMRTANLTCSSQMGGEIAVLELILTAAADLTLQWNQLGNHNFALYSVAGTALPCTAGSLHTCNKSNNMVSGTTSFTNVPAGRHYLVIGSDTPMTAGSVAVQLSGVPH